MVNNQLIKILKLEKLSTVSVNANRTWPTISHYDNSKHIQRCFQRSFFLKIFL